MKRLAARAIILAGLIGVTVGLGALTWATFSVLFVLVFLCPVARRPASITSP